MMSQKTFWIVFAVAVVVVIAATSINSKQVTGKVVPDTGGQGKDGWIK